MQKIEINCATFTFSCIKTNYVDNILFDTIYYYLSVGKFLIIINDQPNINYKFILNKFKLKNGCNIVICSNLEKGWIIYELKNNKKYIQQSNQSIHRVLKQLLEKLNISINNNITIGDNSDHFALRKCSAMHFHVGKQSDLNIKIRGIIPLTEQYEFGLSNILHYFKKINFKDNVIDYLDLIRFIKKSGDLFQEKNSVFTMIEKHNKVCSLLIDNFSEYIIAIIGTGYPFYAICNISDKFAKTPNSIISYFNTQYEYFNNKIIDEIKFYNNLDNKFTINELFQKLCIDGTRNKFDTEKFNANTLKCRFKFYNGKVNIKFDYAAEVKLSLKEYYSKNCFDIYTDIWPCYYCATLQINDLYPNQNVIKYTNISCLECKQTSFMLRNIMGCTPDIDMVIVVKNMKDYYADLIKKFIIFQSDYFLYDTDIKKAIIDNEGPIDLFVTDLKDIYKAFNNLLNEDWDKVVFDSIALWTPTTEYCAQIGLNFALSFEPLFIKDINFENKLKQTRKKYAENNLTEDIIQIISKSSFYTHQLTSNKNVIDVLTKRLNEWKAFQ